MNDMLVTLGHWQLDVKAVREQMYRAATPRERERWHTCTALRLVQCRCALWLLARGWSATQVAEALERAAHTIGEWAEDFRQKGPAGLACEQSGGSPPPSTRHNKRN